MPTDLEAILPTLLPRAIDWVEAQSASILKAGAPLTETETRLARAVGVRQPENIRVSVVDSLPLPDDPELRAVAVETGLLGPGMIGVTFGYGIYVCEGHVDNRLISHECRHVFQYEEAGSIAVFLQIYLQQIVTFGYHDAPFEIDARQNEIETA